MNSAPVFFNLITTDGRFLSFFVKKGATFRDLKSILLELKIEYEKCCFIDPTTFALVDTKLESNLPAPIPQNYGIVLLENSDYENILNFYVDEKMKIPISIINFPNGNFLTKTEDLQLLENLNNKVNQLLQSDFHSKINSVLKLMVQDQVDLKPDMGFFELARVSYHATIDRRNKIQNNPLLESISICEPSNEFKHKKILFAVKVTNSDFLIKEFRSQIDSDQYACDTIASFVKDKLQPCYPEQKLEPKNYALQIPGTDEIIAGKIPLSHFIFIQKYLESSMHSLDMNIIDIKSLGFPSMENKRKSLGFIKFAQTRSLYKSESETSIDSIETYLRNFECAKQISEHEKKLKKIITPHKKIKNNLSVILEGFSFPVNNKQTYKAKAYLYVGSNMIKKIKFHKVIHELNYFPVGIKLDFKIPICQLPRYSKIVIKLKSQAKKKNEVFAFASFALFDRYEKMQTGRIKLDVIFSRNMPNNPSIPVTNRTNIYAHVRLPKFGQEVYFRRPDLLDAEEMNMRIQKAVDISQEIKAMKIPDSPLQKLTEEQKSFLIKNRWNLIQYPDLLPAFLLSFNFWDSEVMDELPSLLNCWKEPDKSVAILLLSSEFYDPSIRNFVFKHMKKWNDADLSLFMLQIVRSLEIEHEDNNEIGKLILKRASLEPKYLGLQLFWQLKALYDIPWMNRRVLWMSAALVAFSDLHEMFLFSYTFTESLFKICKEKKIKQSKIGSELPPLPYCSYTQLPIDPKLIVQEYVVPECFFADSSKRPLILSFKPADPFCSGNIKMMVKVNDDLRQDMITLQIMNVMDELWKKEGLNMRMKIYSVLATGDNQGIIEIVPNSVTISSIQKKKGKLRGVRQNDTISEWLEKATKDGFSKKEQIENFMYSMAGYIVATYVLGIGDRHCSNMMIQKDGHFFHIDFGHFMGHFKTFIGIDRESNMFYFSDAFVHVLGGVDSPTYKEFESLCCRAFCIIRNNHNILVTLLYLMKNTGIPELRSNDDIKYVEKTLMLDLSEEEACEKLKDMLKLVPTLKRTAVSDFCHQIQH